MELSSRGLRDAIMSPRSPLHAAAIAGESAAVRRFAPPTVDQLVVSRERDSAVPGAALCAPDAPPRHAPQTSRTTA